VYGSDCGCEGDGGSGLDGVVEAILSVLLLATTRAFDLVPRSRGAIEDVLCDKVCL